MCVCLWRGGGGNIKEGDPNGFKAPVVTLGATKSRPASSPDGLSARPSGACLGRSWEPRLGQNLWGMGACVTSVPARIVPCCVLQLHACSLSNGYSATERPRVLAGGGGGGGGGSALPLLKVWRGRYVHIG